MFKAIKEFFLGKPVETQAPIIEEQKKVVPVSDGQMVVQVQEEIVQPVVEAKVDPVSVALDLEPVDFAATTTPVTAKKPRKPREPKAAAEKPAKEKAAKPAKAAAIKAAPKKTKSKKS
jgi:hypothetical protein